MGDRALIQLHIGGDVSPVLYLHWSGSNVGDILSRTMERMKNRHDDLPYVFARMVQEAINGRDGDTGFGCWNQPKALSAGDSHGDAGCFLVDVSLPAWKVRAGGGYGIESGWVGAVEPLE